jgi:hypothetical protein
MERFELAIAGVVLHGRFAEICASSLQAYVDMPAKPSLSASSTISAPNAAGKFVTTVSFQH